MEISESLLSVKVSVFEGILRCLFLLASFVALDAFTGLNLFFLKWFWNKHSIFVAEMFRISIFPCVTCLNFVRLIEKKTCYLLISYALCKLSLDSICTLLDYSFLTHDYNFEKWQLISLLKCEAALKVLCQCAQKLNKTFPVLFVLIGCM